MSCFEDFMDFREEIEKIKKARPDGKKDEKAARDESTAII